MSRIILLTGILWLFSQSIHAEQSQITSPDGKLSVHITDENGVPSYSVSYNHIPFILASPLGLNTNIGNFTREMKLSTTSPVQLLNEEYNLPTIKQSNVHYQANRGVFTFSQNGKVIYDVVFQVSNRDVAFKYNMYPQKETLCCVINEEMTGFVLPSGSTTFLCPQSKPMGGFARTSPSYETSYTVDDTVGKNGWGEGYTFPCLFRNNDKGWVLISETGVSSAYCGSRLIGNPDGLYQIGFPQTGEYNGNGTTNPGIMLPGETPWRTITIGETLAPIVETTVAFDVVKPLYDASQEYKYGKGSWSWIIGGDSSCNYDEQIRYIDFSAAMGYQSVLIDALWNKQIGRKGIEKLAEYAKSKGVALYLWYNSNGYWNDAPQSPRGIMNTTINRRKEMKWMQSIGIRGIKVDFIGSDKQVTMQLYEDILADANDYLHFSQGSCDAEAFNACLHPFIRNTVGSMDFGGSTLNKYYNARNDSTTRTSRRITSDVFALATAVLFQSPVQHFALTPNNLTDAPEWAINFMKEVPSTWDEVRFLDGYPGKYIILARRHQNKWYIAGINASSEEIKVKLHLPMISAGETISVYTDNARLVGKTSTEKLNKHQQLQVSIPCNGGIVIAN